MSKRGAQPKNAIELGPRRSPRQNRARQTVEKILDATAELLDEEGHENLTTERVAERSGVNIATLYHYFPNKQALLHALAVRFGEQQQEQLDAIYRQRKEIGWRDTIDKLADAGFEFNRTVKGALAVTRAMQSNSALRQVDYERDSRQSEFVATVLAELGVKGSRRELQTRALVLLQTVGSVMDKALMWYPENAEAAMNEVKLMMKQYINYYIEQSAVDSPSEGTPSRK
ncbi:MAG: TetR/AcrR family transcriptional regulator [Candidatus Hydrogenedentales bacterium]